MALLAAASEGRTKAIEQCLQEGADIHYQDYLGNSALSAAIMRDQWETAEALLKLGFIPTQLIQARGSNREAQAGWSALSVAVAKRRTDWVRRLLHMGVDPNNHLGWSKELLRGATVGALLTAARNGHTDMASLLFEGGASINDASQISNEPLFLALEQQNLPMLQLLLSHGAPPGQEGRDMLTPLAFACRLPWRDGIQSLIRAGADPYEFATTSTRRGQTAFAACANKETEDYLWSTSLDFSMESGALDKYSATLFDAIYRKDDAALNKALKTVSSPGGLLLGVTPLFPFAIIAQNEAAAVQLFRAGVDSQPYYRGSVYNPLTQAVRHNYLKLLQTLLEHGLDPRGAEDGSGWTPLGLASARGNIAAMQLIVARGGVLNPDPAFPKSSPLMLAASNGHPEAVAWLLGQKSNVDLVDNEGNTALHWGAWSGNVAIVEQLLDAGSKIDHRNQEGETPLGKAALNNQIATVQFLLDRGARDILLPQLLREKLLSGPVLDLVVACHGVTAETPPVAAVFFSTPKSAPQIREFLASGGDIDYPGNMTPLQTVINRGEFGTARLLLQLGADPNKAGKQEPRSPLLLAVYFCATHLSDREALPLLEDLLKAGAHPDGDDPELKPPLFLAISGGLIDTIKVLLAHGADPRLQTRSGSALELVTDIPLSFVKKREIEILLAEAARKLPPLEMSPPDKGPIRSHPF